MSRSHITSLEIGVTLTRLRLRLRAWFPFPALHSFNRPASEAASSFFPHRPGGPPRRLDSTERRRRGIQPWPHRLFPNTAGPAHARRALVCATKVEQLLHIRTDENV